MKKRGLIVACSGGKHLAKTIARKANMHYEQDIIERFPDSETKIKIPNVKNKDVYFVQSFYKDKIRDINDRLIEVLLSIKTAKELKARKIYLIAPYLAYLREDIRFRKGEAVSAKVIADLLKNLKKVYVVEPHLHRFKSFKQFFPNAQKVSIAKEIAKYIKKNIKNPSLVGPDIESEQWVKAVAKELGIKYTILLKQRFNSRKVKVHGEKTKAQNVVIIDDIISTGHTLIEASKLVNAKKIYFIGVHPVFSENAVKKLNKFGKVVVSNTIPTKQSKLDCTTAIAEIIKGRK
ncbi:MAG: ribose-phosphate diphosphokinase [archaeon]